MTAPRPALLTFEELTPAHADELFLLFDDPRVWRHIDGTDGATVDEVRARYARWRQGSPDPSVRWINHAVRLAGGPLIGRVQATVHAGWAEIAYVLGSAHWGKGHGREAVVWLRDHLAAAFGVSELWAAVTPDNAASVGLLRALGFVDAEPARALASADAGDLLYRWPPAP